MTWLVLGLVLFLGIHAFSMARGARVSLIAKLGSEGAYKGLYALIAAAGLILVIYSYGQYRSEGMLPFWSPPAFGRHIAMLLMLIAIILLAATYVPSHIRATTRHPMIIAVILWAVAHLLANGDAGSVLLFGAFLAWGVTAWLSMVSRPNAKAAPAPKGFANDVMVVVGGVLIYGAFAFWLHPLLIGVAVMAG